MNLEEVMKSIPPFSDADVIRELSSFHRSDLVLVVSPFEKQILEQHFHFPSHKLSLAPFFYGRDINRHNTLPKFVERSNFVFIGTCFCILIHFLLILETLS